MGCEETGSRVDVGAVATIHAVTSPTTTLTMDMPSHGSGRIKKVAPHGHRHGISSHVLSLTL